MEIDRYVIPGVVRDGVAVPLNGTALPEGIRVGILVSPQDMAPELLSEYERWDMAGDEAWAMIDSWEAEEE